ncbi:DUF561 domain-containing protein [bacterium]|nr:DUF561 domain-containing protein [bacterium]
MRRIEMFRQAMNEKRALKVISGINNLELDRVEMIVSSAIESKATAIDVAAKQEVIELSQRLISESNSEIMLMASSIIPMELANAVNLYNVDAIELGNFESLYREGLEMTSSQIISLVEETLSLIQEHRSEIMFSVTIPGMLPISEQISLARKLEEMNIDLIQTEGYVSEQMMNIELEGSRSLLNRAELTISNTLELSRNIELPIMTSSNINTITAPFAFAAGASVIGCGSCINRLESKISMLAVISNLMEIANRNGLMISSLKDSKMISSMEMTSLV